MFFYKNIILFIFTWISLLTISHYLFAKNIKGVKVEPRKIEENKKSLKAFYHYSSMTRTSPFVPPLVSTYYSRVKIPILSEVQRYKLIDLRLAGVWTNKRGQSKALIITPEDEGVIVEEGSPIGLKGGRIVNISMDGLKVRQFILAPDGTRIFSDRHLKYPSTQKKKRSHNIINAKPYSQLGKKMTSSHNKPKIKEENSKGKGL